MILDTHITLQGEYSIDVFNRDGSLSYSLGPFKNFITSTGLSFPHNFAFADCFRYLSFGLGSAPNSIRNTINGGWGTVNLQSIVPQYSYIGGREVQFDSTHQTSQYTSANFKERTSGISISRGWRVPSGTTIGPQVYFDNSYTFKEIMLSPGRPFVTGLAQTPDVTDSFGAGVTLGPTSITYAVSPGWTTNQWNGNHVLISDSVNIQERTITSTTPTSIGWTLPLINLGSQVSYEIHRLYQLCHCLDTEIDMEGNQRNGLDYSAGSIYYSGEARVAPCAATGAFVRIVKDVPVTKDNFLIFNYTLFVDIETGRVDFAFDMQAGRNVRATKTSNWWNHAASGSHNVVHHGLKMISPGTVTTFVPNGGAMTQDGSTYWSAEYDYGESFMGSWGSPLEPSTRFNRLSAYLTTDNLQFFANAKDGGESGIGLPGFSGQSGLMSWRSTPYNDIVTGGANLRLFNIRQPNTPDDGGQRAWPLPSDFTTETQTPDVDFAYTPQFLVETFSTSVDHWGTTTNTPSSRTREVIRNFQFAGPGQNFASPDIPIRGIVLSYIDPNFPTYHFPYLDCLFVATGSNKKTVILPDTNAPAYPQYSTGRYVGPTNYWYYLDSDAKLTFSFKETWSSPCSPDVDGC